MKKSYSFIKDDAISLLISSMFLIMGCAVKAVPDNVPSVRGVHTMSFSGVSLALVNAEKHSSSYDIPTDKGQKLGFIGNRRLWSKQLIDNLSGELAKRGARIGPKAPLRLFISVPEITLLQHDGLYQFKVTVAVSSKGWKKKYVANAGSRLAFFESADTMASRVAGNALAEAIKTIMADGDFLTRVGKNKVRRLQLGRSY
jgi:uncharacterized lipoprotein YajG